jgi:TIR domain
MPIICLSYRRSDSSGIGGRIYDHLVSHFGAGSVFMDVSGIPYAEDFRKRIRIEFENAKVLVALIGPSWLGQRDDGPARIQERLDPIRIEIYTALTQNLLVVPVLVDNAQMPSPDDLPRNIKEFAYRNAMRVDSGADFPVHIGRLVAVIARSLGRESETAPNANAVDATTTLPSPQTRAASPRDLGSPARTPLSALLPYFASMVILLLLAHYLIVMKLDSNPLYVLIIGIVFPASCGFLLFRAGFGIGAAALLGLSVSLVVVAAILTLVGLIDRHQILPSNVAEWQETLEFVVSITLATAAGNLLACYLPTALRRLRQFRRI